MQTLCGFARPLVTLLMTFFMAAAAVAQTVPVCLGKDVTEEIRQQKPALWARVVAAAEKTINAKALLWKIEKPGTLPSHLFGTVHLTDDRVNQLPAPVEFALNSATTVALEIADLSPGALAPAISKMQNLLVYPDGRSLERLLSGDERRQATTALERAGTPSAALGQLRPWVVSMMLALTDCERKRSATGLMPLDARLGANGKTRGVPVVGLETLADQLRAMAKVPEADQLIMLKATLKFYDRVDDMLETMVQLYLKRDIGIIWPLQIELWREAGYNPAAFTAFRRELVTLRNLKMRDGALPLVGKGNAFIAVGALHLPGLDGLVELLRNAGYTVTAIN